MKSWGFIQRAVNKRPLFFQSGAVADLPPQLVFLIYFLMSLALGHEGMWVWSLKDPSLTLTP